MLRANDGNEESWVTIMKVSRTYTNAGYSRMHPVWVYNNNIVHYVAVCILVYWFSNYNRLHNFIRYIHRYIPSPGCQKVQTDTSAKAWAYVFALGYSDISWSMDSPMTSTTYRDLISYQYIFFFFFFFFFFFKELYFTTYITGTTQYNAFLWLMISNDLTS